MEQASRKDFHHPFKPYDIQYELMSVIYESVKKGQVGIFESPTGTVSDRRMPKVVPYSLSFTHHTRQSLCRFLKLLSLI